MGGRSKIQGGAARPPPLPIPRESPPSIAQELWSQAKNRRALTSWGEIDS
jgi:hypothetical protein